MCAADEISYPGLPFYAKLLGSVPLACTQTFQHAWRNEKGVINKTAKTSLIFSCRMTPDFVMDHEMRHTKGENHAFVLIPLLPVPGSVLSSCPLADQLKATPDGWP